MKSSLLLSRTEPRRGRGFSRIEVLGMTMGLAVFVAVQLPLAGNNRVHSRVAACADNHRRLALAWQLYALENGGWFPPNSDDGNTIPGHAWVPGQGGPGGPQEFNPEILADPTRSLLIGYLSGDPTVFRCPEDRRSGRSQVSTPDPNLGLQHFPAARSVSMNLAVGTNPYLAYGKRPTDGAWLDNNHAHTYGQKWLTYGRDSQLTRPGPAQTFLIIDEDPPSLNDGVLAFGMTTPEWIDFPATWHDGAATMSFTDAHVEVHRWVDARTPLVGFARRISVPGSPDWAWLRDRVSAPVGN